MTEGEHTMGNGTVKDLEFFEGIIESVEVHKGGYEIKHSDGWCIFCPQVPGLPAPAAGEVLRCYGRGLGHSVRGIVIEGRTYRYMSAEEDEARHNAWVESERKKRETALLANLAETDRRIAALPVEFRERMERFKRDGGHEFRRDYEGYELFCCEQAVVIAEALRTGEAIREFSVKSWDEQKRLVPNLNDGHSGNTFGTACALATAYVERPGTVTKLHGALTPLVGCRAYGCKHD